MNRNHLGAASELIAAAYLLQQGYEVFRNVSPTGPADLVIWSRETGEMTKVDVKVPVRYVKQDGTIVHHFDRKALREDVKVLLVSEGEVVGFFDGGEPCEPFVKSNIA